MSAEDLRLAKKQMGKKAKKLYAKIKYGKDRKARQVYTNKLFCNYLTLTNFKFQNNTYI